MNLMMNDMRRVHGWTAGLVFLLMLVFTTASHAQAIIGKVLAARGEVFAVAESGDRRPLKRRSEIHAGDTLVTGAASRLQVRFDDGALVALRPESEYRVDDYAWDAGSPESGKALSTLVKGGLRSITGAIGKSNPEAYQLKTPVATIGVRGTDFEVVRLDIGEAVGVRQGLVQVASDAGEILVGPSENFAFAVVPGADAQPVGLLQPPAGFMDSPAQDKAGAPAPDAAVSEPAQQQEEEAAPVADAESDEGTTPSTGEAMDEASGEAVASGTEEGVTEPLADATAGTLDSGTLEPLATPVDTTLTTLAPLNSTAETTTISASPDARLSYTEWTKLSADGYFAMALDSDPAGARQINGGRAVFSATGTPVITDTQLDPWDPAHATAPIQEVYRKGNAALDASNSMVIDSVHTVYWGVWNGTVNPVEVQTSSTDATVKTYIPRPVFWGLVLPTKPDVIAARTGSVTFNTIAAVQGGGSGGQIVAGDFTTFSMDVNFGTAQISNGQFVMNNGSESWNLNFTGSIQGSFANLTVGAGSTVTSSPTVSNVAGELGGVFTGNNADHIAGGFTLEGATAPNLHAEGVFILK